MGNFSTRALLLISWQIIVTTISISLCLSHDFLLKIPGEILFSICILQWFILEHDFGHGTFFKNDTYNIIFGHLASVFSLLPFYPWKNIHHSHHVWTGWKDLDPTHPKKEVSELSKPFIFFINLCWKLWIPVLASSFSINQFWNLKRLKSLYPQRKKNRQHIFSVFFILVVFVILLFFCFNFMVMCWLPAFIIYLFITDPLLLSQHTHIDYADSKGNQVRPVKYSLQPAYTRSVKYPSWVSKYILYHFDKHGLHHQHPGIPFYKLSNMVSPEENSIHWLKWLKIAKGMPAHILIFNSQKETGIVL